MKVKLTIEEVITQTFEVEVKETDDIYDQVREQYKNGTLVVNNPTLTSASVMIHDENGEETDWNDLHV